MRIQTRAQVEEQARAMRLLREDLAASHAHAAQLAADVTRAKQRADVADRRADRAEEESKAAREALTGGHAELLAANQRLHIANRQLHKQVEDAIGYGPAELAGVDDGEQALAAIEREARAAAVLAETSTT